MAMGQAVVYCSGTSSPQRTQRRVYFPLTEILHFPGEPELVVKDQVFRCSHNRSARARSDWRRVTGTFRLSTGQRPEVSGKCTARDIRRTQVPQFTQRCASILLSGVIAPVGQIVPPGRNRTARRHREKM